VVVFFPSSGIRAGYFVLFLVVNNGRKCRKNDLFEWLKLSTVENKDGGFSLC
jgi:hypothetical protein